MHSVFQARSRGLSLFVSGALGLIFAGAFCGCSLSLEDPAQEARDKLAKVIPARLDLLVGRWVGDSTYGAEDTRATPLALDPVLLEIQPDTSFSQLDSAVKAFPAKRSEGVFRLDGDTLILFPLAARPDTFLVRLRFLGNYLELVRLPELRYTFFHKLKPRSADEQDSLLADSLWALRGRRPLPGVYRAEPLVRDFAYLRFRGDSMFSDTRLNGIIVEDSGPLIRDGRNWTWNAAGGKRGFLADLPDPDSLRLWPLSGDRADSGYFEYARASARHPRDVDMRPLLGHLRGDSLQEGIRVTDYHYGRYYDWILDAGHGARVETNLSGVPRWAAWTLDSGFLALSEPGKAAQRMRVDTAGGRLRLRLDSSALFPAQAVYSATRVAGDFAADPMARFENASHLMLAAGSDTMRYFFSASNDKDRFEIFSGPAASSLWAGFLLPKAQENFQSGQSGFYLAFEDSTPALGRFTCRSRPARDLVIRQTGTDPLFAAGFIQGTCEIQRADSAFADSGFSFEGTFRIRRANRGGFLNPGWSLP